MYGTIHPNVVDPSFEVVCLGGEKRRLIDKFIYLVGIFKSPRRSKHSCMNNSLRNTTLDKNLTYNDDKVQNGKNCNSNNYFNKKRNRISSRSKMRKSPNSGVLWPLTAGYQESGCWGCELSNKPVKFDSFHDFKKSRMY